MSPFCILQKAKCYQNCLLHNAIYVFFALQPKTLNTGTIRETFFQNQLSVKHKVEIPKTGDFIIDDK